MEKAKLLRLIAFGVGVFLVIGALLGLFKDFVLLPSAAAPLSEATDPVPDPVFNMILFTFIGIAIILYAVYYFIKK